MSVSDAPNTKTYGAKVRITTADGAGVAVEAAAALGREGWSVSLPKAKLQRDGRTVAYYFEIEWRDGAGVSDISNI